MRKIKKELPKAQRGYLGRQVAKILGFSDEALEAARKKQAQINKRKPTNKNTNKSKINTNKKKKSNKQSFLDKQFEFKSPSLRQLNPLRIINPGIPNTARFIKKNPLGTGALGLSLAAYLRSRQPGIDPVQPIENFNIPSNFSNDFNISRNTEAPNVNLDSILRSQD